MGAISPAAQLLVLGGSRYVRLRNAAIAAARRNNASLWFAGVEADLTGFVFEESTGVSPATGTDPIGLLLDRSYGTSNLGTELRSGFVLVVVGSPTQSGTYNTATGAAFLYRDDVSNRTDLQLSSGIVVGKTYRVTINNTGPAVVSVRVNNGSTVVDTINAGVTKSIVVTTAAVARIDLVLNTNAAGSSFVVQSVVEVLGIPALQSATANKPTLLKNSAGYFDAVFDPVDDTLSAALASGGSPAVVSFTDTGEVTGFVSATTSGFVIGNPTIGGRKVGVIVASATALPAADLAAVRAFAGVVRGAQYP